MSRVPSSASTVTFSLSNDNANIAAVTAFHATGEMKLDNPARLEVAKGARSALQDAMWQALESSGEHPQTQAELMLRSLGWDEGYERIKATRPDGICVYLVHEKMWFVIPELAPIVGEDDELTWLDRTAACHRRIDIDRPTACPRRLRDTSLAIIYQEADVFAELAREIGRNLTDVYRVDHYPGGQFAGGPAQHTPVLQEVFHQHRAVLFVGHYRRPEGQEGGGWQVTEDQALLMQDLAAFLGVRLDRYGRYVAEQGSRGSPVPEVVFTSSCCGATGDPPAAGGLLYPHMFLTAGVRVFIGTWMDMVFSHDHREQELATVRALIEDFFLRWADDPRAPVTHLYEAKRTCGFKLLTSLYQLYTAGDVGPERADASTPPAKGAMVAGVHVGDQIGQYVLRREICNDEYARMFWADHVDETGEGLLVQIPDDGLQGSQGFVETVGKAILELRKSSLGRQHLIPSRVETQIWSRDGNTLRPLQVLLYDLPEPASADDWFTLNQRIGEIDRGDFRSYMDLLEKGRDISALLAELHSKRMLHGNLYPGSIMLLDKDEGQQILLKDTWVWRARPARRIPDRYAAPQEPQTVEGTDLKHDCWGLGVILYELTSGRAPFGESESPEQGLRTSLREVVGEIVPEALDRIVSECLVPSAQLRPDAETVARRLNLALGAGGIILSDFAHQLDVGIQAGQRLFDIWSDDLDEVESAMRALASVPRRRRHHISGIDAEEFQYRLLVAQEATGLIDVNRNNFVEPWVGAAIIHEAMRRLVPSGTPVRRPTIDDVARVNTKVILDGFSHFCQQLGTNDKGHGQVAILLVRGSGWWDFEKASGRALRGLQSRQDLMGVFVVADRFVHLDPELDQIFTHLVLPSPPPAVLFERIMGFSRSEGAGIEDVPAETAIELSMQIYPCRARQLELLLRSCTLEHGRIDHHLVEYCEEERGRVFKLAGAAAYTPASRLPRTDDVALPTHLKAEAAQWAEATRERSTDDRVPRAKTRVMIHGPHGSGKTTVAKSLAKRAGIPLVRIDASACLRGQMGESESALRATLATASALGSAAILFDDVDRLFTEVAGDERSAVVATLGRLSGIILHWMDTASSLFPDLIVIMTATDVRRLPARWRRRIEWQLDLDLPVGREALGYREAVFSAVFQQFSLEWLSRDRDLLSRLARQTDPYTGTAVLSAAARRSHRTALGNYCARLESPADIQYWVHENILLFHNEQPSPHTPDFWISAVERAPE